MSDPVIGYLTKRIRYAGGNLDRQDATEALTYYRKVLATQEKAERPVINTEKHIIESSDQCTHCKKRGDVLRCEMVDCTFHGLWYVKFLKQQIRNAKEEKAEYALKKFICDKEIERLKECMKQAGLEAFIKDGAPEDISKQLRKIAKSWIENEKILKTKLAVAQRALLDIGNDIYAPHPDYRAAYIWMRERALEVSANIETPLEDSSATSLHYWTSLYQTIDKLRNQLEDAEAYIKRYTNLSEGNPSLQKSKNWNILYNLFNEEGEK